MTEQGRGGASLAKGFESTATYIYICTEKGSNLQPLESKSNALSIVLSVLNMEATASNPYRKEKDPARIELTAFRFATKHSATELRVLF